jgi:hypothetical protein
MQPPARTGSEWPEIACKPQIYASHPRRGLCNHEPKKKNYIYISNNPSHAVCQKNHKFLATMNKPEKTTMARRKAYTKVIQLEMMGFSLNCEL